MLTLTSPPLARIRLIRVAASESDETARVPSQVGEQPPPLGARMNASWNAFRPVAFMTSTGSGGLLSKGIRYGAEAYQLVVRVAASACSATTALAPSIAALAAARAIRDRRLIVLLLPGDIGEQRYTRFLNSYDGHRPM